ncbi:SAM-dependent DNA methyltransferase [Rhodobacteraceae bacterium R_SAG3]|nr:SAM-dependent DNA methyltransferase [Rhodobacteraceae bacterium R_SAG3]
MRGGLEPSEYKHVALGLIFLKYLSEAFQAMYDQLAQDEFAGPEEYLAENVFWVPETARWSHIQQNARSENIGKIIDEAMEAIEAEPTNETLTGVLPKNYARPTLDKTMLGELVDLFSNIKMHDSADRARDLLGRVYEYFISGFGTASRRSWKLKALWSPA